MIERGGRKNASSPEEGSKIFAGHRALGYVANHVPSVTRYIHTRREHLVVTAVGRVFHTYGCAKLGLLSVSKIHPEDINCLAADAYHVFSSAGSTIYAWRRGSELKHTYVGHTAPVHLLLPFGPHLIAIDTDSVLKIWDIKTEKLDTELEFPAGTFEVSAIVHPSSYMNKILLGSTQGSLQLWNIKTCKKIHKFKGWGSAVLCLEQAPAIDVIAIGLKSGEIFIHNIKYDETIVKFSQDCGPVTSLSFRSDGQPIMVSASRAGHLAIWDLEERKLTGQMRQAHDAEVAAVNCLTQEPLMVTSSPDNTLKQWIFDMPDGSGRLLRLKEGHSAPPTKIRFYGGLGQNVLSAGEDSSLRSFSTVTDLLNKSFGVASFNRKASKKHKKFKKDVNASALIMPPVIDFTTETTRDRDWDNIACVHRETQITTTWSYGHQKMGDLQLRHERFKTDPAFHSARATCLCLSFCGNFVFIGYSSGHVDKYNIQSGIHRGELGGGNGKIAHRDRTVRAIETDGLNQRVITGDSQGQLLFWSFSKPAERPLASLKLSQPLLQTELHRDSGLLAVTLQDFSLQIIDIVSRKTVRSFGGHSSQLTDLCWSADARWVLTSSVDSTVKVWDVPTGDLVDHIRFPSPVASLSLSPTSDLLATSHLGDLGIYLWTNLSLYSHITLRAMEDSEDSVPRVIQMPMSTVGKRSGGSNDIGGIQESEDVKDDEEMETEEDEFASPEQLADDLITLALLPNSRWQNLLHLDVIKARNKPKQEEIQKPKSAPFFLPTISGLETKFDLTPVAGNDDESMDTSPSSRGAPSSMLVSLSEFGKKLLEAETGEQFEACMRILMEKGPSQIEVEVTNLSPLGGGTEEVMLQYLLMILSSLRSRSNFEACQAYLSLFLKTHADAVIESSEMRSALEQIKEEQLKVTRDLEETLVASSTLVAFFKNAVIC